MSKNEKLITYTLLAFIIISIFLRFYGLSQEYLSLDEQRSLISAIKIQKQDFKSGVMYFQEHPGLGKWLIALPINFISSNYAPLQLLGPNMFAWDFVVYEAVEDTYTAIKYMNALIGVLAILFVYLITKKLFNKKAALWGAAIIATSPDMIAYSRHEILMKIIAITTVLATIFFYLKYLTEENKDKRWAYLAITILALTFNLGSRNFDPLFIIPTIIISQFFINRGKEKLKENLIVSGLVIISFLFVFFYTYPPEAKLFAQEHLEAKSPTQLLGFTFLPMIYHALTRNSYLFSLSFILIFVSIFYYLNKFREEDKEKPLANLLNFAKPNDAKAVLLIFLLVSFIGIGFTRLGSGMTYNITFFAAVFTLAGIVITKLIEKKQILKYVFLLIILINTIQILPNFPYSTWDYSNLKLGEKFHQDQDDKNVPESILKELETLNNPPINSNMLSVLVFYKGEKSAMSIPVQSICTQEYFNNLLTKNPLILTKNNIQQEQFICPAYKQLPLKEIKNFDEKAFLYKIET